MGGGSAQHLGGGIRPSWLPQRVPLFSTSKGCPQRLPLFSVLEVPKYGLDIDTQCHPMVVPESPPSPRGGWVGGDPSPPQVLKIAPGRDIRFLSRNVFLMPRSLPTAHGVPSTVSPTTSSTRASQSSAAIISCPPLSKTYPVVDPPFQKSTANKIEFALGQQNYLDLI